MAQRENVLYVSYTLAQMSPMNNRRGFKGSEWHNKKKGISAIFLCVTETSHVSAPKPLSPLFHPRREIFLKSQSQLTTSSSSQPPVIVKSTRCSSFGCSYTLSIAAHNHQSIWLLFEDDQFIVLAICAQLTLPQDLRA